MIRKKPDSPINIRLQYPYNDSFDYQTYIERIDLDKAREEDIKSGKGFIIKDFKSIKKDIKKQDGIFSSRFGSTLADADSFIDRYKCDCGITRGAINHGMTCDMCGTMVKFVDDDMSIFGWKVLKEPYFVIHPNLYMSLQAFIGDTRLDNIIFPIIDVDVNGKKINKLTKVKQQIQRLYKKDEIYKGIGLFEFRERFDEIMKYYLSKYPHKKNYYDDIMAHKHIIFTRSIPVFTTLLRPTQLENGSLKYEQTNENYQMINSLVEKCNKDKLEIDKNEKHKLNIMYGIQANFNEIYSELKEILSKKKGDIRSSIGGRYAFSSRSVIAQGTDLMPDQVRLPYHGLCELLQQVIINILVRTYSFSYSDAYKKWYKAQLGFDQIVYDIIDNLIKDSDGGLPLLINRNPSINFGSIIFVRCVGINLDYTMSIPLAILKMLGADFDGDTLNILYLYNKDFIEQAEKIISPRMMFISHNDARCNSDLLPARDTIINANSLKSLCEYTEEEIEKIRLLQNMR